MKIALRTLGIFNALLSISPAPVAADAAVVPTPANNCAAASLLKISSVRADTPTGPMAGTLSLLVDSGGTLAGMAVIGQTESLGKRFICASLIQSGSEVALVHNDLLGDVVRVRELARLDLASQGGTVELVYNPAWFTKMTPIRIKVARDASGQWDLFVCQGGDCRDSVKDIYINASATGIESIEINGH